MTIATRAVLAFYADSKYIKFFHLLLPTQYQTSEKICLIFEKREDTPQKASDLIEKKLLSDTTYQRTLP